MSKLIFINLPVADLPKATAFYESIGAKKNPQFSDGTTSCIVFSDTIYAMLLTHDRFSQFTTKKIVDARSNAQVLNCISAENRSAVDELVAKARQAGGRIDPCPKQDFGFMYGRSFEDLDGHIWEIVWMDAEAAKNGCPQQEGAQQ